MLFKLCCGCVEVCQKAKKKAERPRAHARISDDKKALILAWHALGRSSQEMVTNLHVAASTAHTIVQRHSEGAPPGCQRGGLSHA